MAKTQEPTIASTQEPATAETQEPAADIDTEMQELEVQGAATLLSLHQEDETQEAAADVAVPQEPVTPQLEPTMAFVLEENEFLNYELEAYKQELAMAKEAYEKELNLYTLARTVTMSERNTTENPCREYMCYQCGDIYYQAGYKVMQIPMSGVSPTPPTFPVKEELVVTQEPAIVVTQKPSIAETQEPTGPPKTKTEPCPTTNVKLQTLSFVNKVVQTMPIEEFTPPSQINIHTFVEQSTQTLPHPTTCNAKTQTQPWDEQAVIQKWKKEYAATQVKSLQEHKQI
jgi:hypothetical protein